VQLSSKKEMLTLSSVGYSIGGTNPSTGKIPSIKLKGLSFYELAKNKKLFLESIQIVNPEIAITLPKTKPAKQNSSRIGQLNKYPFDPNQLASVEINEMTVKGAKISGLYDSLLSVDNIGFRLNHFLLHPDTIAKLNLPFHSKSFDLAVSNFNYRVDTLNKIHLDSILYHSKPSQVELYAFSFI
jgi:hypothetical protein